MRKDCGRTFDEALLSGYLDGELTQGDEQGVRLHLEDCSACRSLVEGLIEMREAAMSTPFPTPADDQWNEAPRGAISLVARNLGWTLLVVWLLGALGLAIWEIATEPGDWIPKLLIFTAGLGVLGVFLSVLLDRIRTRKTDRYRKVER